MSVQPFLGQIQPVGFNFAPRGWTLCDGQLLPIAQNTALFSLLGTVFGGDGRTTFALPDLRGRTFRGVGSGAGLSHISWGERGGSEAVWMTTSSMPSHDHTPQALDANADSGKPSGMHWAKSGSTAGAVYLAKSGSPTMVPLASNALGNTGGNQPFEIMNPYLGIYICIALAGIYPSRN